MRSSALALAFATLCACAAEDAREVFGRNVARELERRCAASACHGELERIDPTRGARFELWIDARGRLRDLDQAYAETRRFIDTTERPTWSSLLRKPLALAAGGLEHGGGHPFRNHDDPTFRAWQAWIAMEHDGGEDATDARLTPLQRQFAERVQPVLRDRGCMVARCHGPLALFAGLTFSPPADGQHGDFSVRQTLANYEAARLHVALFGTAERSRLVVKALPLTEGGIPHRGGNDAFFPPAAYGAAIRTPELQALLAWIRAEQRETLAESTEPGNVAFVRGPASPRTLLALAEFAPGSDIWLHEGLDAAADERNLTATAHPEGPADVRDPAVSHDGLRLAFAMRRSENDCHNLYELALDTGAVTQLTHDEGMLPTGGKIVNRFPTYGPGPHGPALYFASSRAGVLDEGLDELDFDLYRIERDGPPERLTWTQTPELTPTFLATGEFRGTLAFTVVRRPGGEFDAPVFRFPPDRAGAHLQTDYHPHHGRTAPGEVTWALRALPDGRDVTVLFDRDNLWRGGALAVIDRQLGPDPMFDPPQYSVPGFRRGVSIVDELVPLRGRSEHGAYFDPSPLPDGRILVAFAPGPLELEHASPVPDGGIYVLSLGVDARGNANRASLDEVTDARGVMDDQPVWVQARPLEDEPHEEAWSADEDMARIHVTGAEAVASVTAHLLPLGAKAIDAPIAAVRVVHAIPTTFAATPPIDPERIRNRDPASTWWSNGIHGPVVVLGTVPLEPDGSALLEVPARTPLRTQLLGADGLALTAQTSFFQSLPGGYTLKIGAPLQHYRRLCAGCHGALDGIAEHALMPFTEPELDAVTTASITLASHELQDPERPRAPHRLTAGSASSGAEGFDFGRDVAPIFARSCGVAGCHAGAEPAGALRLEPRATAYYDEAYEALQAFGPGSTGGKRYVDERGANARGSYLVERILGRELDAPRALGRPCPPPGSSAPPLSPEQLATIIQWIELGAIYRTSASGAP